MRFAKGTSRAPFSFIPVATEPVDVAPTIRYPYHSGHVIIWAGGWSARASQQPFAGREVRIMLFLMYWEADESLSPEQRLDVAHKLTESGLLTETKIEIVSWDTSADGSDTLVVDADDISVVERALDSWRNAAGGYLKFTKATPVAPA